jgi:nucleoside-diphosphate-sugar epimerase
LIFFRPQTNSVLRFLETDLGALENIKASLFQVREKYGGEIAAVIHTAAYYSFTGGDWEKYQKITIDGTANLLTVLQAFDVKHYIHKHHARSRPLSIRRENQ